MILGAYIDPFLCECFCILSAFYYLVAYVQLDLEGHKSSSKIDYRVLFLWLYQEAAIVGFQTFRTFLPCTFLNGFRLWSTSTHLSVGCGFKTCSRFWILALSSLYRFEDAQWLLAHLSAHESVQKGPDARTGGRPIRQTWISQRRSRVRSRSRKLPLRQKPVQANEYLDLKLHIQDTKHVISTKIDVLSSVLHGIRVSLNTQIKEAFVDAQQDMAQDLKLHLYDVKTTMNRFTYVLGFLALEVMLSAAPDSPIGQVGGVLLSMLDKLWACWSCSRRNVGKPSCGGDLWDEEGFASDMPPNHILKHHSYLS